MTTIQLVGREFTFSLPQHDGSKFEYRALVAGHAVVLSRIADSSVGPIGFDVPRANWEKFQYQDAAELVRLAIGQAVDEGLFAAHPSETVYLRDDAPRWPGVLYPET
ncbi:hypothetical protein [Burkholderia cepacia]|uniref:hypothetical protein n=1 Tax=Burkholderia cepacia TaxID=292 RepID=UPI00398EEE35